MAEKSIYNNFYGDQTRWFVGIVESIDDPMEMGRVRVRIHGIHSANHNDIPQSALPWAQVVAPVTHAGTSGLNGTPVGLKPTAQVFGIFLDGKHSQQPIVLGSIPRIEGENTAGQTSGIAPPGIMGGSIAGGVHNVGGSAQAGAGSINPAVVDFSGNSNLEIAYNAFKDAFTKMGADGSALKSYAKELAAGMVGNLMAESGPGLDPLAYNSAGGGRGANGIAQWRGPRLKYMQVFAQKENLKMIKNKGDNYILGTIQDQLKFAIHELQTTHKISKWAHQGSTVALAADAVERKYEVSDVALLNAPFEVRLAQHPSLQKRIKFAKAVYNKFVHEVPSGQNGDTSVSSDPSTGNPANKKEQPLWSDADVAKVEELRQFNQTFTGADPSGRGGRFEAAADRLTFEQKAYARSQGYISSVGRENIISGTGVQ